MKSEFLILSFALVGGILIHEIGHLIAARWYGVRVLSVSLGLGREICGFTDRFGTRWKLALLPFGGICNVLDQSASGRARSSQSRTAESLSEKPLLQQVTIIAAGPLCSVVFGSGIICLTLLLLGQNDLWSEVGLIGLLVGEVSILIGLFNFLPFPPLDGWRLLLCGIEAFRGSPVPGPTQRLLHIAGITAHLFILLLSGAVFWKMLTNL